MLSAPDFTLLRVDLRIRITGWLRLLDAACSFARIANSAKKIRRSSNKLVQQPPTEFFRHSSEHNWKRLAPVQSHGSAACCHRPSYPRSDLLVVGKRSLASLRTTVVKYRRSQGVLESQCLNNHTPHFSQSRFYLVSTSSSAVLLYIPLLYMCVVCITALNDNSTARPQSNSTQILYWIMTKGSH